MDVKFRRGRIRACRDLVKLAAKGIADEASSFELHGKESNRVQDRTPWLDIGARLTTAADHLQAAHTLLEGLDARLFYLGEQVDR